MGMYDELPVYKAGYDLLLEIFQFVRNFETFTDKVYSRKRSRFSFNTTSGNPIVTIQLFTS